jgi:hypothetical protein
MPAVGRLLGSWHYSFLIPITVAHNKFIHKTVITVVGGRITCTCYRWMLWCSIVRPRASWPQKYPADTLVGRHRGTIIWHVRPCSGCCVSSKSPKLPFISAREPKATSDVPGQKGVVILTQRSRSQSTTCCGEGPAYVWTYTSLPSICWQQCR